MTESNDVGHTYRRRLFLSGVVDAQRSLDLCAELMTMDATGDEPVELMLNCTINDPEDVLSIVDVLETCGVAVDATIFGSLGGGAIALLGAIRGARSLPMAMLSFSSLVPSSLDLWVSPERRDLFLQDTAMVYRLASRRSTLDEAEVRYLYESQRTMRADEARDLGFFDTILQQDRTQG